MNADRALDVEACERKCYADSLFRFFADSLLR